MDASTHTMVSVDRAQLLAEPVASPERPQLTRLIEAAEVKIVRLTLAEGQVMREHSTNAPLIVQVLEGEVLCRISGEQLWMPAGAIVYVEPSVQHEIEAIAESHLLLTICS